MDEMAKKMEKNLKLSKDDAKLVATTLKALSRTFKRDVGYRIGSCSVYNVYPEDLEVYARISTKLNELFDNELF